MFWPILKLLENDEDGDPFVIGLYAGMCKPTNTDEYLQPLIDDALAIRQDGIVFDGRSIELTILNLCGTLQPGHLSTSGKGIEDRQAVTNANRRSLEQPQNNIPRNKCRSTNRSFF